MLNILFIKSSRLTTANNFTFLQNKTFASKLCKKKEVDSSKSLTTTVKDKLSLTQNAFQCSFDLEETRNKIEAVEQHQKSCLVLTKQSCQCCCNPVSVVALLEKDYTSFKGRRPFLRRKENLPTRQAKFRRQPRSSQGCTRRSYNKPWTSCTSRGRGGNRVLRKDVQEGPEKHEWCPSSGKTWMILSPAPVQSLEKSLVVRQALSRSHTCPSRGKIATVRHSGNEEGAKLGKTRTPPLTTPASKQNFQRSSLRRQAKKRRRRRPSQRCANESGEKIWSQSRGFPAGRTNLIKNCKWLG